MAINETEKNGGRVLGRAGNRGNRGNARRERMTSLEDEQRRLEPANDTFARPTMGPVSSHQYPVGPPSMGYPSHAPSMPPFPRMSSEMYDPLMHERGSPPSRIPPNPPRYHPGSMVFQPRPDRFMERPYFPRPPGEIPPIYWSSPQRHALLSPNELGQMPNRDRFNSETSEGTSSVFEGRDDLGKSDVPNGPVPTDFRPNVLPGSRRGRLENDSERFLPQEDNRASHRSLPPPQHNEVFRRSPSRLGYPSELRSPHLSDDRPVHILDERGRFAQDRMRSVEESLRDHLPDIPPSSSDSRVHKEGGDALSQEEQANQSTKRGCGSSSSEIATYNLNRSNENGDGPVIQEEARTSGGYTYSTDRRFMKQSPENWKRYEASKLETAPNLSDGGKKHRIESPDEKLKDVRSTEANSLVNQVSE